MLTGQNNLKHCHPLRHTTIHCQQTMITYHFFLQSVTRKLYGKTGSRLLNERVMAASAQWLIRLPAACPRRRLCTRAQDFLLVSPSQRPSVKLCWQHSVLPVGSESREEKPGAAKKGGPINTCTMILAQSVHRDQHTSKLEY